MGLRDWLKKNGIYEVKRLPREPKKKTPTIKSRAPLFGELALGFADDGEGGLKLQGVPQDSRSTHFYIVGASGSGKTRFMQTLALQDARNREGFGIIDAHSDLTEEFKARLYILKKGDKKFLEEEIVLIDASDEDNTVCFNPLERVDGMDTDMVVGELVEVFQKMWADAWGNRMEYLLTNTLTALVENNLTLAELPLFLTDINFRNMVLRNVEHAFCRDYFDNFNSHSAHIQREWAESTLNKVGQLLNNRKIKQMFVSPKSSFSFRDIMDNQKILLVKLDRGRLKKSADVLGSLLVAKLQMTAFARTDTLESDRLPFYLYVDEFQNFAEESFLEVLAQSRKYKLPLILAHQQLAQLPSVLRASILTNCSLQAYFRVSRADADMLAKESLASIYQNPPGWEHYIQQLQELPPQVFVFKNKNDGGVATMVVQELLKAHEVVGQNERTLAEAVSRAEIGKKYLRSRTEIEEAYQKRHEELLGRVDTESFKERK